jgi:hypothetical protein
MNVHSHTDNTIGTVLGRLQNTLPFKTLAKIVELLDPSEIEVTEPDNFLRLKQFGDRFIQRLNKDYLRFFLGHFGPPGMMFNGRPMDLGRTSLSPKIIAAVAVIGEDLKTTKAAAKTKPKGLNLALNLILSNLAFNRFIGCICIHYSRGNSRYKKGEYNPSGVGFKPLIAVVDGLIELGYVDHLMGSKRKWQSRMRATPSLAMRLEDEFGITVDDVLKVDYGQIIQLKKGGDNENENVHLIPYKDTVETIRMRENLDRYNALLAKTDVFLPVGVLACFNVYAKNYHRIFCRESFELNGRFYGPWWVNAKGTVRRQILIDGEETVSLDFKAMNPHLLYSMAGTPYSDVYKDGDPYRLEGYDKESRDARKFCFLVAINSESRGQTIKVVHWKAAEKKVKIGEIDVGKALDDLYAKHTSIREWIYTDSALKLANQEAKVTETILEALIEREIPALNVHDEFIVGKQHEGTVRQVMIHSYQSHGLTSLPDIKVS